MAYGDKEAFDVDVADFAGLDIAEVGAGDAFKVGAADFLGHGIPYHLNLGIGEDTVLHGLGGAQFVAAVDEVDLVAEGGEVVGLLAGGVAAAHHCHVGTLVEGTVAGGTGRDALSVEPLLAVETQPACRGAGGDDDGVGLEALAAVVGDAEGTLGEVDIDDNAWAHLSAETLGLLAQVGHHGSAGDAFRVAGKVLDFGGDGELAAGLETLVEDGMEVGAAGVDSCCVAGGAGTDDEATGVGHRVNV